MNLTGLPASTDADPATSAGPARRTRRSDDEGFGAALWLALLGRGAEAFRKGESPLPGASSRAGGDVPARVAESRSAFSTVPGFDPARLGQNAGTPRSAAAADGDARAPGAPVPEDSVEAAPDDAAPAVTAPEPTPDAGAEPGTPVVAPFTRGGDASSSGPPASLATWRGRLVGGAGTVVAGAGAPARTTNPPVPGTRPGATFVIPFQDEGGQEGRIRLAVRGSTLLATILSTSHDTLRRLGDGLGELQHALAERGFADSQVSVRPLRTPEAAPSRSPEREPDPDQGTRRGQSHHDHGHTAERGVPPDPGAVEGDTIMIESTSASGSLSALTGSRDKTQLGKNEFMTLLLTQLRHQDPMSPLEPHEFAAQLASFSSVEQLEQLNQGMAYQAESLELATVLSKTSFSASLVGRSILAEGNEVTVPKEGKVDVTVEVGAGGGTATLKLLDASGAEVASRDLGAVGSGRQTLTLPEDLPEGTYTYRVEVVDADGQTVPVKSYVSGLVSRVSFDGGRILLRVGGTDVALESLVEIGPNSPAAG